MCAAGLFRRSKHLSRQFTTILKNDFVSVGGITAFVWSKVQTEFDWRIHRKSKAIFLTGVAFFFSKIAYYESFWGNICRGFFVWASRALVALQKLILKQGDGSSHQYCIITNQPIDVAFMRKNKNVVCMYSYICSRPFIITGLQWLQPEIRILIIF